MRLPGPDLLGLAFGLSELGLSLAKHSGTDSRGTDRRSLRRLWTVILLSVAAAILATRFVHAADSRILAGLYPAGVALFAAGLALRWWAIVHLGRFFTVDVAVADDHRVVDTGPYRYVRHPSYAGVILAFLGYGVCLGNWVSLAAVTVPITSVFLKRIEVEEAALTASLRERYAAYARRSKRLLPFLY